MNEHGHFNVLSTVWKLYPHVLAANKGTELLHLFFAECWSIQVLDEENLVQSLQEQGTCTIIGKIKCAKVWENQYFF